MSNLDQAAELAVQVLAHFRKEGGLSKAEMNRIIDAAVDSNPSSLREMRSRIAEMRRKADLLNARANR